MYVEIVKSNCICDYCKNRAEFNNSGLSCPYWYENNVCDNTEFFEGKELIEVEMED